MDYYHYLYGMKKEIYKDIPGYEGLYQVSNWGNVYSLPKSGTGGHSGKVLKQPIGSTGYYQVTLCKDSKEKNIKVHVLVAMTFLEHVPCGFDIVIDHKDNNPLNNLLDNLHLVTHRYNTSKDVKNKTSKYTGVNWHIGTNKWLARIKINDKQIHLGLFVDEDEAGRIYQTALKHIDKYNGNNKEFRDYIKQQTP